MKNRRASKPPSRPTPEDLVPPKGVLKSLTNQALIQTIPASILFATRCALLISDVHKVALNQYSVEFAIIKTSSSVSKGVIVTTGPKISS